MGGRSQDKEINYNRWQFISELSDERLDNYGKYTQQFMLALNGQGGIYNKETFNDELAKEYKKRTGMDPKWKTSIQEAQKAPRIETKRQNEIENESKRRGK